MVQASLKCSAFTTIWVIWERFEVVSTDRRMALLTCWIRRSSRDWRESNEVSSAYGAGEGTRGLAHLLQDVVDVTMMLREAVAEDVILVDEAADVHAAERVGL